MRNDAHEPRESRHAAIRALTALIALAGGFLLARAEPILSSTAWFTFACLGCTAAALLRGTACKAALALAVAAFGAAWFTGRIIEPPRSSLASVLTAEPVLLTVQGVVLERPQILERSPMAVYQPQDRWGTTLAVEAVAVGETLAPSSGQLRVYISGSTKPEIDVGDRLRVTGHASAITPPDNPGMPDWHARAAERGIAGTLDASVDLLQPLPPRKSIPAALADARIRWISAMRERAATILHVDQATDASAILHALLLGQRDEHDLSDAFTRVGLAHVMAISGFHLAILASLIAIAIRTIGDLGRCEPIIAAAFVVLFMLLIPPNAPVLRAGFMVLAVLAAESLGRRHARTAVLAWTAFALLLFRPLDLWSMGFQLSFGLVAALITIGPRFHQRLLTPRLNTDLPWPQRWWSTPASWITGVLSTSILCWAIAAPIVIYHTGQFSPLGVLATLVVLPVVLVLLAIGYAMLLLAVAVPPIEPTITPMLEPVASAVAWIVRTIDQAPMSSITLPAVSLAWAAASTLLAVYLLVHGSARRAGSWTLASIIVGWLALEICLGARVPDRIAWRIDVLSIGDGSFYVLRSGRDAIIWDCGSRTGRIDEFFLRRTMRRLGVWRAHTLVLTHPDLDHYNGVPLACDVLGVRRLLTTRATLDAAATNPRSGAAALLAEMHARRVEIDVARQGDQLHLANARLRFLSPPADAAWHLENDHSLVAFIETATGTPPTLLLTGDIQHGAILHLLLTSPSLSADAVDVPHHGSYNDQAYELLSRLRPAIVIQSTGPARLGDRRWARIRGSCTWLSTAELGALRIEGLRDGSLRAGPLLH